MLRGCDRRFVTVQILCVTAEILRLNTTAEAATRYQPVSQTLHAQASGTYATVSATDNPPDIVVGPELGTHTIAASVSPGGYTGSIFLGATVAPERIEFSSNGVSARAAQVNLSAGGSAYDNVVIDLLQPTTIYLANAQSGTLYYVTSYLTITDAANQQVYAASSVFDANFYDLTPILAPRPLPAGRYVISYSTQSGPVVGTGGSGATHALIVIPEPAAAAILAAGIWIVRPPRQRRACSPG